MIEATITARLIADLDEAEAKAWDALARYKFQMFGYWCAIWVHQNHVGGFKRPNPWAGLVKAARARNEIHDGRNSQHVLKAEGESPDATDRENCADASPDGGPMGVGQAAAAAPAGEPVASRAT